MSVHAHTYSERSTAIWQMSVALCLSYSMSSNAFMAICVHRSKNLLPNHIVTDHNRWYMCITEYILWENICISKESGFENAFVQQLVEVNNKENIEVRH